MIKGFDSAAAVILADENITYFTVVKAHGRFSASRLDKECDR